MEFSNPTPPTKSTDDRSSNARKKAVLIVAAVLIYVLTAVFLVRANQQQRRQTGEDNLLISDQNQQNNISEVSEISTVAITKNGFSPAAIQVQEGTTVTWINQDTKPHRIVTDGSLPDLDSEEDLQPNDSYSFTFEHAGTYVYKDNGRNSFSGTVIVE